MRGTIPFDTYKFQDECVETFLNNRFSIILKSRQLGMSTLVAAFATWMVLFQKDKNVLIIATKLSVAQNFIRKVKTMITNLPPWLVLPQVVSNNKQLIEFSHGSSIKAIPTSDDAGRSEALSLLIVDEAAFVRNFDELWMGLYPTLSTGGRAILLSTPNGVGGQYYKLYQEAKDNLNEFSAIKIPWYEHPERDQAWFDSETKNLSKRQVAQEYLCDFASSGDTFVAEDSLRWLQSMVKSPIERSGIDKNVWIWKKPISDHRYIISADISRGDSKDFSAFHIIDTNAGECVAEYKGKVQPDTFAEILYEYGEKYGNALVCPENNSYGYATVLKLKDLQYSNLYYRNRKSVYLAGYSPKKEMDLAGFTTSGKTRNLILSKLEELLRNRQLLIYSSRFYEEIKTFMWVGNKAQAMKGYNDDLVMSLAIGSWIYDTSSDYNRDSRVWTDALLGAMKVEKNIYPGVENPQVNDSHQSQSPPVSPDLRNVESRINKLFQDLNWLIKD